MAEIHTRIREKHIVGNGVDERIVNRALWPALPEHGIPLAGWSDAAGEFRFLRVAPRFGQVLVCRGGIGRVWVDGRWAPCAAGQAYVTPPGAYHAYEATVGEPWRVVWTHLTPWPEELAAVTAPALLNAGATESAFTAAVTELYREAISPASGTVLPLWAALVRAQAVRIADPAAGGLGGASAEDPRLRKIWQAVEVNPDAPWTVEVMADLAGLSGEQLRRLCQATIGRSPMRQVTHLRMRYAAALLASGSYTVAAAARKVGYGNDFAFSTAFKRCLGRPPSSYRRG